MRETDEDDIFDSDKYANMRKAWHAARNASGAKEIVTEVAALGGKAVWNLAVFSGQLGLKALKERARLAQDQKERSGK